MKENNKSWLKELKKDDLVFVRGFNGQTNLYSIEKITPKGNIKVGGGLYNPETGLRKTSDVFDFSKLEEATPEKVQKFRQNNIIKDTLTILANLRIKDITYEQFLQLRKILNIENSNEETGNELDPKESWIIQKDHGYDKREIWVKCPNCNYSTTEMSVSDYNFCPNCGIPKYLNKGVNEKS